MFFIFFGYLVYYYYHNMAAHIVRCNIIFRFIFLMQGYFAIGKIRTEESMARTLRNRDR